MYEENDGAIPDPDAAGLIPQTEEDCSQEKDVVLDGIDSNASAIDAPYLQEAN